MKTDERRKMDDNDKEKEVMMIRALDLSRLPPVSRGCTPQTVISFA